MRVGHATGESEEEASEQHGGRKQRGRLRRVASGWGRRLVVYFIPHISESGVSRQYWISPIVD
jgi:hypothetical protein